MQDPDDHTDSEIVFALVSPVGTDTEGILTLLERKLHEYDYEYIRIKLSDYLKTAQDLDSKFVEDTEFERINSLMNRGNELRENYETTNILSAVAIMKILDYRHKKNSIDQIEGNSTEDKKQKIRRHKSLKR